MNIFKKTASFLLSAVLLGSVLSVSAYAEEDRIMADNDPIDPSESLLIDDADVLTDSEEEELTEELLYTAEKIDMNILVFISGTSLYSDSKTVMFAEELCHEHYDFYDDSVVLYLDMSGNGDESYAPYDYIYTRNRARFYFSGETDYGERVSSIFSNMNPYLPRSGADVPSALEEFFGGLRHYYDMGPDSGVSYYYIPDTGEYVSITENDELVFSESRPVNWGFAFVVGLIIGLIAALITFFVVKSHYRFKSKPSSLQYTSFDQVQYGVPSDVFLRKYRTKTRIERSSGGGGGGGGTSSGGGGGGNHR